MKINEIIFVDHESWPLAELDHAQDRFHDFGILCGSGSQRTEALFYVAQSAYAGCRITTKCRNHGLSSGKRLVYMAVPLKMT